MNVQSPVPVAVVFATVSPTFSPCTVSNVIFNFVSVATACSSISFCKLSTFCAYTSSASTFTAGIPARTAVNESTPTCFATNLFFITLPHFSFLLTLSKAASPLFRSRTCIHVSSSHACFSILHYYKS